MFLWHCLFYIIIISELFIYPFEKLGSVTESTGTTIDDVLRAIADGLHFFNAGLEMSLKWIEDFIDELIDISAESKNLWKSA